RASRSRSATTAAASTTAPSMARSTSGMVSGSSTCATAAARRRRPRGSGARGTSRSSAADSGRGLGPDGLAAVVLLAQRDPARLRLGPLGQGHGQHAVLELRPDVVDVDVAGQREGAVEAAGRPLAEEEVLRLLPL